MTGVFFGSKTRVFRRPFPLTNTQYPSFISVHPAHVEGRNMGREAGRASVCPARSLIISGSAFESRIRIHVSFIQAKIGHQVRQRRKSSTAVCCAIRLGSSATSRAQPYIRGCAVSHLYVRSVHDTRVRTACGEHKQNNCFVDGHWAHETFEGCIRKFFGPLVPTGM